MDTYSLFEYVLELVQESSIELIKIYKKKGTKKTTLIFPKKRDDKIRISEQDLRFVFTSLHGKFSHPNLSFSVETPTEKEYSFSGKGERSASSDLSFYHEGEKVLNIEFKAHNPEQKSIDKDIEKLMSEPHRGAWVHIFKNEDSGTVKKLFEKFNDAIKKIPKSEKPISFHILILNTGTLLSRKGKKDETDYSNIFNIEYSQWEKLDRPGKYFFYNGHNVTENDSVLDSDWIIDKFRINEL